MDEILRSSYPFLPGVFAALLLLLLAPVAAPQARRALAAALALGGLGLLVLAAVQSSSRSVLDVVNPFLREGSDEPFLYVTEHVDVPGYWWPLAAALALLIPAAWISLRSNRPAGSPRPIVYGSMIGLWALALRLALEKTGAPAGLVWALGLTSAMPLICVFVGGFAGARGLSFGKFVLSLLGVALVVRGVLTAVSYFATTSGLGTHLDVRVVTNLGPPGIGTIDLSQASDTERWLWAVAALQMTFWVLLTVAAGLALGVVPFLLARRRHQKRQNGA